MFTNPSREVTKASLDTCPVTNLVIWGESLGPRVFICHTWGLNGMLLKGLSISTIMGCGGGAIPRAHSGTISIIPSGGGGEVSSVRGGVPPCIGGEGLISQVQDTNHYSTWNNFRGTWIKFFILIVISLIQWKPRVGSYTYDPYCSGRGYVLRGRIQVNVS